MKNRIFNFFKQILNYFRKKKIKITRKIDKYFSKPVEINFPNFLFPSLGIHRIRDTPESYNNNNPDN